MRQETTKQTHETSLRELLETFRRRKGIIIQTWVVIVAVGILITFVTKPVYRATTRILVEGKSLAFTQLDANNPLGNIFVPPTGYDVATQIEVLQSQAVTHEVFDQAHVPYNSFTPLVKLRIKQVMDTNVVEIDADSNNAGYAREIARTYPNVYQKYITGNRKDEIDKAYEYAQRRLTAEEDNLDKADLALEQFKKRTDVVNLDDERRERLNRVSAAESDLRAAQAKEAGDQARLDTLIAERKALPDFLESPTTSTNQIQLDAQKDRIALLEAERAKTLILFKENSPEIEKIDAQLKEMRERLAKIPASVTILTRAKNPAVATYDDKITEARAAQTSSQATLTDVKARADGLRNGMDKYSEIERELSKLQRAEQRHSDSVTMLAKSVEDLDLRRKATHDPVLTITPADEVEKVAPKLSTNIALAVLLGLILGVGFAMLQEFLDDRIHTPDEARGLLGAPSLGYVPLIPNQESRLITGMRSGSLLESYRVLRSNVQFATVDSPVSSLMITSTVPGEGKSMTACNLAIAMAMDGKQVILVDADLRLPTIHEKLGLPQHPGLTSVLLGRNTVEEALQETTIPNLRVLTAGPLPPNPAELLNSRAMQQAHEELKAHAEVVLFDCPPSLMTADAQVMSAVTDGVIYVMQLGETKKSAARQASELMWQAHARILGLVFNKIDLAANRDNYYYSYGNYYTRGVSELAESVNGNGRIAGNGTELVKKNGAAGKSSVVADVVDSETEEKV